MPFFPFPVAEDVSGNSGCAKLQTPGIGCALPHGLHPGTLGRARSRSASTSPEPFPCRYLGGLSRIPLISRIKRRWSSKLEAGFQPSQPRMYEQHRYLGDSGSPQEDIQTYGRVPRLLVDRNVTCAGNDEAKKKLYEFRREAHYPIINEFSVLSRSFLLTLSSHNFAISFEGASCAHEVHSLEGLNFTL